VGRVTCIRCRLDPATDKAVDELAEALRTKAHLLPGVNMTEAECYDAGLFRGAIERIRGQFAASMAEKRDFAKYVLNKLEDENLIQSWLTAGGENRYDYSIIMPSGKVAVVELKGCLDGNNTNIFERPQQAQEFYIWSVCSNAAADPRKNAWSGIHTRLGAEIIDQKKQVDGLVIWDMVCGTIGRPCPKIQKEPERVTELGPYRMPPPCLYLFPATIAAPRNNPTPQPHKLEELEFLSALYSSFRANEDDLYSVYYETRNHGADLQRLTRVDHGGTTVKASKWKAIRRA
jgi:hypothetical protein